MKSDPKIKLMPLVVMVSTREGQVIFGATGSA